MNDADLTESQHTQQPPRSADEPPRTVIFLLRTSGVLATILAILGGVWLYKSMPRIPNHAVVIPDDQPAEPPPRYVQDFSLTERSGKTITRADLLGRPFIMSFIFTRCAGPCPRVTGQMRILQDRLTNPEVRLVTLTVDPKRDTPDVLRKYADDHGADPDRWLFLTGERDEIYDLIISSFQMPVQETENDIIHTTNIIHVEADGRIAGKYNALEDAEMAKLRRLLNNAPNEPDNPNPPADQQDAAPSGASSASADSAAKNVLIAQPQESGDEPEERFLSDFKLTERSGKTITRADLLGKPTAVGAIFIRCAGPCPRVTGQMRMLQDRLKDYDVRLVTLTVDPKNDTPELLARYADNFGADKDKWWFLTGDELQIYTMIGKDFQMPVVRKTGDDVLPGFEIVHTTEIVHIRADGKVLESYNALDDAEMAQLRRALIDEAKQLAAKPSPAGDSTPTNADADDAQPAPPARPQSANDSKER